MRHKCAGPLAPGTKPGTPYTAANLLLEAWTTMCLAHPEDLPSKEQTISLLRAAGEANCAQLPFIDAHMHKLAPLGQVFGCHSIMHSWTWQAIVWMLQSRIHTFAVSKNDDLSLLSCCSGSFMMLLQPASQALAAQACPSSLLQRQGLTPSQPATAPGSSSGSMWRVGVQRSWWLGCPCGPAWQLCCKMFCWSQSMGSWMMQPCRPTSTLHR